MREYRRKRKVNILNLAILVVGVVLVVMTAFFAIKFLTTKQDEKKVIKNTDVKFGKYTTIKNKQFTAMQLATENEKLDAILKQNLETISQSVNVEEKHDYTCASDLYFDTIVNVKCTLKKGEQVVSENTTLYNKTKNDFVTFDSIFRKNPYLLKDIFPNKDINQVNRSVIAIDNDNIYVGEKTNQFVVPIKGNDRLFLPGNGLPSLFKGEKIERVQFDIKPNNKMVAFTFDDGPLNENHVKIRNLFNKYKIPATFYVIGDLVDRHPDVILQTFKDGHTIANHTYTHPGLPGKNLTTLPEKTVREEYEKTSDSILKITGEDPLTTRPPGGFIDEKSAKYTHMKQVLWDVDSQDWMNKQDAEAVYQNVRKYIYANSIVLFHDLYDSTVAAVERLIPELLNEGYQFVDIDTFLANQP